MLISNQVYIPSFPLSKEKLQTLLQVIGASFLIAFCAQIRIPLFFTPVPLTGHVLAVLFVGALLGSRNGALSVLLYLFEGGILNLPVFSNGNFGFAHFFGPTGGYLLGFVAQAYLAGWVIERQQHFSSIKIFLSLFASCIAQLALGTIWLAHLVGWEHSLAMGFLPFIIGDAFKALAVTTYLRLRST